jgi:hypothetical protein
VTRTVLAAALALVSLAGAIAPAPGQTTLLAGDAASLSIAGYGRSLTALHDRGFDLPDLPGLGLPARQSGFHGGLVRVKWLLEGDRWRLEIHDRLQVRIASEDSGEQTFGFGVGAQPERLVDLRSDLIERDRVRAWHDVDRLSLTVHTPVADVTLGRQAITWGTALVFPVADLWAAFAPFEQDTDEKPGIDAVRALFYPGTGIEVDAVVAYRGSADDLSGGVRATVSGAAVDVWAGGGRFWRQLMAMGGVTRMGERSRWRAEAVLPWDQEKGSFQRPRITVGADWLGGVRLLSAEYHYNGIGARDPGRYTAVATDDRVMRGESYFLGRHYLGLAGSWSPDRENRLTLALNALANLGDRSAALAPHIGYDVGQAARVSIGGLASLGEAPHFDFSPPFLHPRSEFALYGNALFAILSIYF